MCLRRQVISLCREQKRSAVEQHLNKLCNLPPVNLVLSFFQLHGFERMWNGMRESQRECKQCWTCKFRIGMYNMTITLFEESTSRIKVSKQDFHFYRTKFMLRIIHDHIDDPINLYLESKSLQVNAEIS